GGKGRAGGRGRGGRWGIGLSLVWSMSLFEAMRPLRLSTLLPTRAHSCVNIWHRRWLAHAISDYYGLESKSVTVGNPGRRVVYLGFKSKSKRSGSLQAHFPRPMWEVC